MNWHFVHVPKTGGNSIAHALADLKTTPDHYQIRFDGCHHPASTYLKYPGWMFGFVRNPYSRLWSAYQFMQATKADQSVKVTEPWNEFVTQRRYLDYGDIFRPQCWYLDAPMDFIGRFETLQADFDVVCDVIGATRRELPHLFRNDGPQWRDVYTLSMLETVGRDYAADFDRFWYDPIPNLARAA